MGKRRTDLANEPVTDDGLFFDSGVLHEDYLEDDEVEALEEENQERRDG
jgi:hypothetical protein